MRESKRMITCTQCKAQIDPLAVFPESLCVECYSMTAEANRPLTARELAQMWGAK